MASLHERTYRELVLELCDLQVSIREAEAAVLRGSASFEGREVIRLRARERHIVRELRRRGQSDERVRPPLREAGGGQD